MIFAGTPNSLPMPLRCYPAAERPVCVECLVPDQSKACDASYKGVEGRDVVLAAPAEELLPCQQPRRQLGHHSQPTANLPFKRPPLHQPARIR
jgi:hypothetical protein